jgi:hypothetical protein
MADSTDLLVGGARVYFNPGEHLGVASGEGWIELGNIPELSLTRAITLLEHETSTDGERLKDKSIITGAALGVNCQIDNISPVNWDLIVYGSGLTSAVQAGASIVDETQTTPTDLSQDKIMFTAETNISSLVVDDDLLSASPYTLGTDYEVLDATTGAVKILASGSITAATVLYFTYTSAARTRWTTVVGSDFVKEGWLRIEFSPSAGKRLTYVGKHCALKIEGDTSLMSTDWSSANLVFDILKDVIITPAEPYGKLYVDSTSV